MTAPSFIPCADLSAQKAGFTVMAGTDSAFREPQCFHFAHTLANRGFAEDKQNEY